jgi:hypothetical protein
MKKIIKIKNTVNSKRFWMICGLLTILDGLIKVLSFGRYIGQFNINYLTNSKNKRFNEKN